jgi:16S rRNA (guanine527-N7)-methyltransferase
MDSKPEPSGEPEQMRSGASRDEGGASTGPERIVMREDRSARANARIGRIQDADARLDREARAKLDQLAGLISGWPGLISGPAEPLINDCLVLVEHLGDARTVVDVGSGGGLPGLPLKIARPDLRVTLIEADQAKAAFLVQACSRLQLRDVDVVAARAEDAGHDPRSREKFDVAVARAVAPLPVLVELCLPFVAVGGRLLAQKTDKEEVRDAIRAIELCGGGSPSVVAAPSTARAGGTIISVPKTSPTPDSYPRRAGVPARKPLH